MASNAYINGDYNTCCERRCDVSVGQLRRLKPGKEKAVAHHPANQIGGYHQKEIGKQGDTTAQLTGSEVERLFDQANQGGPSQTTTAYQTDCFAHLVFGTPSELRALARFRLGSLPGPGLAAMRLRGCCTSERLETAL